MNAFVVHAGCCFINRYRLSNNLGKLNHTADASLSSWRVESRNGAVCLHLIRVYLSAYRRGDAPPSSQREMLMEAQATYATGLLAVLIEDPNQSQVLELPAVPTCVVPTMSSHQQCFAL